MTTLRTAAQQALEALEYNGLLKKRQAITALRAALAEPIGCVCGEPSVPDVVHRKDGPCYMAEPALNPAPGYCKHCKQYTIEEPLPAEPVQEPVAWMVYTLDGKSVCVTDNPADFTDEYRVLPLFTAPPQRKPLSAADALRIATEAVGRLQSVGPVQGLVGLVRAVEAAHGIKE